jgi:hypothetical protein
MWKALIQSLGASATWKAILTLGVVLTAGLVGCHQQSTSTTRIDQVWKSSESKPALDLPGKLQVKYVDRNGNVELKIQSAANPVILVDVKQNGTLDADAKSYSTRPDNGVCVTHLIQPENINCGSGITRATAKTETVGDQNTVIWTIPKSEIQTGTDGSDIVIELFDQYKQSGTCFPKSDDSGSCLQGAPFAKVYHLQFGSGTDQSGNANGPAIAYFNADPPSIAHTGDVRLRWSVSGSTQVSIAPGIGNVPAQGETLVSQNKSTEYTLTAIGPGGDASSVLRIASLITSPPDIPQVMQSAKLPQPAPSSSSTGSENTGTIQPNSVSHEPPSTTAPQCSSPCVTHLSMAVLGDPIEPGAKLTKQDPRLVAGSNLIATVQYAGAEPKHTTLEIDWYLGSIPVSYSPAFQLSSHSGAISWPYNNQRVDAGDYKIILKLDGQPLREPVFGFSVTGDVSTH